MSDQSASPSPSLPSPLLEIGAMWPRDPLLLLLWEAISAFLLRTAPGEGYGLC